MSDKAIADKLRQPVGDRAMHCCEYCRSQASYSFDPPSITSSRAAFRDQLSQIILPFPVTAATSTKPGESLRPITDSVVQLFHPRTDVWDEHFAWSDDFTMMLGLTPAGRATISALRLNCRGLVNIRRVLRAIGEHPPELYSQS